MTKIIDIIDTFLLGLVSTATAAPTDGHIATRNVDATKNMTFIEHTSMYPVRAAPLCI